MYTAPTTHRVSMEIEMEPEDKVIILEKALKEISDIATRALHRRGHFSHEDRFQEIMLRSELALKDAEGFPA